MTLKKSMDELKRISEEEYSSVHKQSNVVVLDNVRSAYNVGSVFRTSDAFGVSHVYLCGITSNIQHKDVRKTALGAEKSIPSSYINETKELIHDLKTKGYIIIALEQTQTSLDVRKMNFKPECKYALVLGNEVKGVSEEVLEICDYHIEIPQVGSKHSLNVSNAFSILVWNLFQSQHIL